MVSSQFAFSNEDVFTPNTIRYCYWCGRSGIRFSADQIGHNYPVHMSNQNEHNYPVHMSNQNGHNYPGHVDKESVASGSPQLRRFFGAVLARR